MNALGDDEIVEAYSPAQAAAAFALVGGVSLEQLVTVVVGASTRKYFIWRYPDYYHREKNDGRIHPGVIACFLFYQEGSEAGGMFASLNEREKAELGLAITLKWPNVVEANAIVEVPSMLDSAFLDLLDEEDAAQRALLLNIMIAKKVAREMPPKEAYGALANIYAEHAEVLCQVAKLGAV